MTEKVVSKKSQKAFRKIIAQLVMIAVVSMSLVIGVPWNSFAASTYYVDAANGNDTTGNGSSGSPWKTIGKAASAMAARDTCKIRSGVYRETVIPANSGTSGNSITFQPDTGANVTVSGADLVSGSWTVHSGNIYKKTGVNLGMGDWRDQVFVDGSSMNLARYPNTAAGNNFNPNYLEIDAGTNDGYVLDSALTQANGYWDGAMLWIADAGIWNYSMAKVSTYTTGRLNIDRTQPSYSVRMSTYDNNIKLIRNSDGSVLGTYGMTVQQNTTYNLKVVSSGSNILVYLNNGSSPVITAADSSSAEGNFSLAVESSSSSVAAKADFWSTDITGLSANQVLGRKFAAFGNSRGWQDPEGSGFCEIISGSPTVARLYTQPQIGETVGRYENASVGKDFTFSTNVKLLTAGNVYLEFRKAEPKVSAAALGDWGLGTSQYFILGKLAALDYPGEWYYDKPASTLYLQAPNSDNPGDHTIEAKARNLGFDLAGKSNIVIKGIKLFGCTIDTTGGSNNVIDGINANYPSYTYGYAYNVGGICLGGTNNTLKNSTVANSTQCLVTVQGDSNKVINNLLHDGTYGPINWESLIQITGKGHLISHNTVYNSGRSVIGGEFFACDIQYNDFHHGNYFATDTGLLYTAHNDLGNTEIHNNWWHDNSNRLGGWSCGTYLDESSANALIYRNAYWNLQWRGIVVNHLSNFIHAFNNSTYNVSGIKYSEPDYGLDAYIDRISNNIASDPSDGNGESRFPTGASSLGAVFSNNLAYGGGSPLFVNPGAGDLRLQSGSACIDLGTVIRGIADAYTGSAPDIGAYEYGGTVWTAGHNFDNPPNPVYSVTDTDFKNLVVNGSLDLNRMGEPAMNSLYGWTRTNDCTAQPVYDASGAATASRFHWETGCSLGAGQDGIEQTITGLTPGKTYEIRGYLRAGAANQTVRLGVKNYGGSDTYQSNTGDTSWETKTFRFTTGPSATSATIYAYKSTTGGYAFVDDIMVSCTTTVPGPTSTPAPTPTPTPVPTATPTPVPGTITVNDNTTGTADNQFEFVGSWGYNSNSPYNYLSDCHFSMAANDYYQVRFYGTQIKLYSEFQDIAGIAAVSVDGGSETTVDFYSSTHTGNTLVYTSPVLAAGEHILKVRITGNKNANSGGVWIVADRVDIISGAASTPTPTPVPTPTPPVSGMAAYWAFNEGSGTTASDSIGTASGNVSGAAWVNGKSGKALDFNGQDSNYVAVSGNAGTFDRLTIGMWVKVDSLPHECNSLLSCDGWDSGDVQFRIDSANSNLIFALNGNSSPEDPYYGGVSSTSNSFGPSMFDSWHHVAVTYDSVSKTVKFYIDGVLNKTATYTSARSAVLSGFELGSYNWTSRTLDGTIDEVKVYNRVLSGSEITALAQ